MGQWSRLCQQLHRLVMETASGVGLNEQQATLVADEVTKRFYRLLPTSSPLISTLLKSKFNLADKRERMRCNRLLKKLHRCGIYSLADLACLLGEFGGDKRAAARFITSNPTGVFLSTVYELLDLCDGASTPVTKYKDAAT